LFLFCFSFCFYAKSLNALRSGGSLNVVAVEVALEVEVGQRLTLTDRQELAQRRIRLDVMLVLEAVALDILVDRLGDLRAAHQSARGATEEGEELSRDLRGALEDGRLALDLITVRINLGLAAALAGILHLAVDTLLQTLEARLERRQRLTSRGGQGEQSLDVIIQSRDGSLRSSNRLHGGGGDHYRGRRSNNLSSSLSLSSLLRNRLLGRGLNDWSGGGRSLNRGSSGLLGYARSLGGGGAHCTGR